MPKYTCKIQESWFMIEKYKGWLRKVDGDDTILKKKMEGCLLEFASHKLLTTSQCEVVVLKQFWRAVGCLTPPPWPTAYVWLGESETESPRTSQVAPCAAPDRSTPHRAHPAPGSAWTSHAAHTTLKVGVLEIEVHRVCFGVTVITPRVRSLSSALDYVPENSYQDESAQKNANDN